MPSAVIWAGRLLVIIGIAGYAYGFYGGNASITAMIPAFFGIVLTILGHLALARESLSKHMMHLAMFIALLGFVLPAGRLVSNLSGISLSAAVISQALMALICLVLVIVGVQSFVKAQQDRMPRP